MWMENVFAKKGFLARIAQKKNAIIIAILEDCAKMVLAFANRDGRGRSARRSFHS